MAKDEPIEALYTSQPQGPNNLWWADYRYHADHPATLYRVRPPVKDEIALPDEEWLLVTGMLVLFVQGERGPRRLRTPLFAGDDVDEKAALLLGVDTPMERIIDHAWKETT